MVDGTQPRMKGMALFSTLLCVAGCSAVLPSDAVVDRIEAITARNACVGALDRWHRQYEYRDGNTNLVSIIYTEAGHRGLAAGRFIAERRDRTLIDDSQHRVAGGTFDIASGRLIEWQCGCNFPPYDAQVATECRVGGR